MRGAASFAYRSSVFRRAGTHVVLAVTFELERSELSAPLRYAELVYFGQWFSPLREAIDAFVVNLAENVTGSVTLQLYKGSARVVSRSSPFALYSSRLASFDMRGYTPGDAEGFIRLFGLQTKGRYRLPVPVGAGA